MNEEQGEIPQSEWDIWFSRMQSEKRISQYSDAVFITFHELLKDPQEVTNKLPKVGTPDALLCPRIGFMLDKTELNQQERVNVLEGILRGQITTYPTYEITVLYRKLTADVTVVVGHARTTDENLKMITPEDTRLIGHTHPTHLAQVPAEQRTEALINFMEKERETNIANNWFLLESRIDGGLCLTPSSGDIGGFFHRLLRDNIEHTEIIVSPFGISRIGLADHIGNREMNYTERKAKAVHAYNALVDDKVFRMPSEQRIPRLLEILNWKVEIFDNSVRQILQESLPESELLLSPS